MTAKLYDIFLAENGRLLTQVYGLENARLNASGYAQRLSASIGYCADEGQAQYVSVPVSRFFKRKNSTEELQAFIRASQRDFDAATFWMTSPEFDAAPDCIQDLAREFTSEMLDNIASFQRELSGG